MMLSLRNIAAAELKSILAGLMFYTRIPVRVSYSPDLMPRALKYFPAAGWIAGIISGGTYYLCHFIFSPGLSAIAALTAGILTTGAMHEDGFADVCDGFGGGWNKARILRIMKDSNIGVFGTLGVLITFLLRYKLIEEINPLVVPVSIIMVSSFSRFMPLLIIRYSKYASDEEGGKSKSTFLEEGISTKDLLIALFLGIIPVLLLNNTKAWLILLFPVPGTFYLNRFFNKWIGGYRGDCIGAVQQVSEIFLYAGIVLLKIH